jgi:hypothetical protein
MFAKHESRHRCNEIVNARWAGELTVAEIMSDPIVQAVMKADSVDAKKLEATLMSVAARNLGANPR